MKNLIIVRGGGDLATGTIAKLAHCGFPVLVLEIDTPSAIRRNVAFSEAVYEGWKTVEKQTCFWAKDEEQALQLLKKGKIALLVDPKGNCISHLKPLAVVDAILAKKNLGTTMSMVPITIALGPGFEAGVDVHAVVETKRGHSLGRIYYEGTAIPNTGVPGVIAGFGKERVLHSPVAGVIQNKKRITDTVKKGEIVAWVESVEGKIPIKATIDGLLRGLIRDGFTVTKGFKVADIDPRIQEYENCFTISDKARCIGGGVLEALLYLKNKNEKVSL